MYGRCLSMTSDRIRKGIPGHECLSIGIIINGETYDARAGHKTDSYFCIIRKGKTTIYYENFNELCESVFQYQIVGIGLQKVEPESCKAIEKILGSWNELN